MFAIVETGGKQYKVKKGQTIKIEKLPAGEGSKVNLETLMIADSDGKEINLGKPSLDGKVEGKIIKQARDKKITVVKYKNKTRYKKTLGHRQAYSQVEITNIA